MRKLQTDVVVIDAGLASLMAASQLHPHRIPNR